MRVSIELSESQAERLRTVAERFGLQLEDLLQASVLDLLSQPDEGFDRAAVHVLRKNVDLYRRLA